MKTENILLLIIAGVILYQYSKQAQPGSVHWISCDDPQADPVMCAAQQQDQLETILDTVMVP